MRRFRSLILVVFVLTLGVFGVYTGRIYLNRDVEGPVITCRDKSITASIEDSDAVLLSGVKAVDSVDGDVSSSLIIESVRMDEENQCAVTYAAFDNANNVSKASRTVEFEDYRQPHFTISKPLRFVLGSKSEILKSLGAKDCIDGDITNRIKLVNKDKDSEYTGAGIYNYEVQVTNSIGDLAVLPISVEFYADTYEERLFYPNIYLRSYVTYIEKGVDFQPKDYLDSVKIGNQLYIFDENISGGMEEPSSSAAEMTQDGKQIAGVISYDAVKYQSNVKPDEPGIYTVEYSCTTKDNYTGTTQMTVVVE